MAENSKLTTEKKKPGGVHSGHRGRVKERFLKEGLNNFEQHQVLELLLFFGIPMKDTNEMAHALLDTFGSLYKVMEAPYEDIRRIPGMTDNAAVLINLSCQLARRYWTDRCEMGAVITCSRDVGDFMKYRFIGERVESLYMISLDNRSKVLNCSCMTRGDVNFADASPRKVVQQALQDNATQVILVHNHPNGHAYPSSADIEATEELARALMIVDVRLLDHVIVSEDDFVSMSDTRALHGIFKSNYIGKI